MGFDATGDDNLARSVDDPSCLIAQRSRCRYRGNSLALDRDVPFANTHGSNNLSAADDQVQHEKAPFPCLAQPPIFLGSLAHGQGEGDGYRLVQAFHNAHPHWSERTK